jgi:hypothetical protein
MKIIRHGDVLLTPITQLPRHAQIKTGVILARGEVTGHSHRILETNHAQMFSAGLDHFLEIKSQQATLVHEEHAAIVLERGLYKVWMQREYRPDANRWVED